MINVFFRIAFTISGCVFIFISDCSKTVEIEVMVSGKLATLLSSGSLSLSPFGEKGGVKMF